MKLHQPKIDCYILKWKDIIHADKIRALDSRIQARLAVKTLLNNLTKGN